MHQKALDIQVHPEDHLNHYHQEVQEVLIMRNRNKQLEDEIVHKDLPKLRKNSAYIRISMTNNFMNT